MNYELLRRLDAQVDITERVVALLSRMDDRITRLEGRVAMLAAEVRSEEPREWADQ